MKTVIVGGASLVWIPIFVKDLCAASEMENGTLLLNDINSDGLQICKAFCEKVIKDRGAHITVETDTCLERSLEGANVVICSALIGGHKTWALELDKILSYGIAHPKGMSIGPGGMIMALKQIPFVLDLTKRMEEICPNAWLLNFANPMQLITLALKKYTSIKSIGLCHGVMNTIELYCKWLNVDQREVNVRYGGVNHFEILWEFSLNGRNLLPDLLDKMDELCLNKDEHQETSTREMYRIFGGMPTNHDIHSIEFTPFYLKRNVDLSKYGLKQNRVSERIENGVRRRAQLIRHTAGEIPFTDIIKETDTELLDKILHAIIGNVPMVLAANLINEGCIENLPDDLCVEIPVILDRAGAMGCHVGKMPEGLDAFQTLHGTIQKLIVKAAVTGDRSNLVKAMSLDPMCYDLSMDERKAMIDDLIEIDGDYLPLFNK